MRRGVCQFYEDPPAKRDATVKFNRPFVLQWIFGKTTFAEALEAGDIAVDGDAETVSTFLSKFEPFNEATNISIAVR